MPLGLTGLLGKKYEAQAISVGVIEPPIEPHQPIVGKTLNLDHSSTPGASVRAGFVTLPVQLNMRVHPHRAHAAAVVNTPQ